MINSVNTLNHSSLNSNNPQTNDRPCDSASRQAKKTERWRNLHKDCPICSGRKKGCQISPDERVITCRDLSANPVDWHFKATNSIGSGVWLRVGSENDKSSSYLSREEYLAQREKEKEAARLAEEQRVAALLSPQERHQEIEKLVNQLSLSEADRQILKSKGLTDQEIDQNGYRSLPNSWLKVSQPISDRLPGIKKDGQSLRNTSPGILCPIKGENKLYSSLRQYNPRHKEFKVGKYVCLSSSGRGLKIHDENGELPIALRFPSSPSDLPRIGLCEGLEIKPVIASDRLGIPMISTGGHNLAGSPIALKKAIAQAQKLDRDSATITIYGDAGAVINKAVRNDYIKAAKLLISWGYKVEFAWWGQIEKSVGDIDEIDLAGIQIEYISLAEFEDIVWQNQQPSEFKDWLISQSKSFGLSRHFRKGFNRYSRQEIEVELPEIIHYDPKNPLPSKEDYLGRKPPKIKFKKCDRHKVIVELRSLGWQFLLDKSFMGTGKSHDLGTYANSEGKLWYLDLNHRNPSVSTVEDNFVDLPVRHGGLIKDPTRTTPGGQEYQHWAKEHDDHPDIEALCENAYLFTKIQQKGYSYEDFINKDEEETNLNPICGGCKFVGLCATGRGDGYGFRYARKKALEEKRIRASINSLPALADYDYGNDIAIVEEASQIIEGTKTVSAGVFDIAYELLRFKQFPLMSQLLDSAINPLLSFLYGKEKLPRYGLAGKELQELIGKPPEDILEAIGAAKDESINLSNIVEQAIRHSGWGKEWKQSQAMANWVERKQAREMTAENIQELPSKFLVDFMLVWGGIVPGTMRINSRRELIVTVKDNRHGEILRDMNSVILLDATADKNVLAKKLDVDANSIIEIEQEIAPIKNLTVINVEMEGMGSNQYSESCQLKIAKLIDELEQKHEQISVLGIKKYADIFNIDGYWFKDNRGTNAFKGKRAIAAFGKPLINVGDALDEYQTLFGSEEGFEQHYQGLVNAEVTQLVGRQRAHQFPEEKFIIYLIGTDHQTDHLGRMGIDVVQSAGFEITPEAGTKKQTSKFKLLKSTIQAIKTGVKLTVEQIADRSGLSTCYIKRLIKGLGGMKAFKKWVLSLYETNRESSGFFDPQFLLDQPKIQTWLELNPLDAAIDIIETIRDYGWKHFQLYLDHFSASTQAQIWSILLPLMLSREEILELQHEIFPSPE